MKKLLILAICFVLAAASAGCGNKNDDAGENVPLSDIPSASADKTKEEENNPGEERESDVKNEAENKSDNEGAERSTGASETGEVSPERNADADRREIRNNLRDAEALIDEGMYDDAREVIKVLQTRELTDEEKEQLNELQKRMLTVSD